MSSYIVTGTSTSVGKTYITCNLLTYYREREIFVKAIKPIITGVKSLMDKECDTYLIAQSLNDSITIEDLSKITPWRFTLPLAPNHASVLEKKIISYDDVINYCRDILNINNRVFIEMAGGIMSPITDTHTTMHFAKDLNIPIILVVLSRLGCISECLTAVYAAKHFGVKVRSIIINESSLTDYTSYAIKGIQDLTDIPIYVCKHDKKLSKSIMDDL